MKLWSVWFAVLCLMLLDVSAAHYSLLPRSKREAQRAFVFASVGDRGLLLMIADKKVKGVHYQLPGGRIDAADFEKVGVSADSRYLDEEQLVEVGKIAAAREVYEETGYSVNKDELHYLAGISEHIAGKRRRGYVRGTHWPQKLFYETVLNYTDFTKAAVQLSHEHIGYVLEPNLKKVPQLLSDHSGGDPADAMKLLLRGGDARYFHLHH